MWMMTHTLDTIMQWPSPMSIQYSKKDFNYNIMTSLLPTGGLQAIRTQGRHIREWWQKYAKKNEH